jgi:hypothetical protein
MVPIAVEPMSRVRLDELEPARAPITPLPQGAARYESSILGLWFVAVTTLSACASFVAWLIAS